MKETTVTLNLSEDDIRLATTSVLEYLSTYPPLEDEHSVAFCMGVHMLYDILRSTFDADKIEKK